MRGPEHRASGGLQLMGSSISGLKLLMGKKEPALFICLSFCQQALDLSASSSYLDPFQEIEYHYR